MNSLRQVNTLIARQMAGDPGSAQGQGSSSASALLSALIPSAIISIIMLVVFLLFRPKFQRIYQPRTYLGRFTKEQQTPAPSQTLFGWISDFRELPDDLILNAQSLDGYLFLRYIKICGLICFAGALMTWPILFPVNATAPAPAVPAGSSPPSQFDVISFSNSASAPNRYYAHALLAWLFFGMVLFIFARESLFYIHLRQAWLLSPEVTSRMSSRTVLFTDVPREYLNEAKLRSIFPSTKHVWIATDTKELEDLVKDRDKTAMKLEGAEIKLSQTANKQRLKMVKKNTPLDNPLEWVDQNKRPTHKLKPLIGKKVDTIDWCREHLKTAIPEVEAQQAKHWNGQAESISAVFIEFDTIQAAESAFQQVPYHKPKQLQARAIGMRPAEVIWGNLGNNWFRRDMLYIAGTALVVLMILFWTPFTIFVGALCNINYLTGQVPFLSFINQIPKAILGLVTGLLPVIVLSILLAIVPIFLRLIAKFTGLITVGQIEMQVQNWYFAFQVVQVFLVTTFASAATAVAAQVVANPASALTLLAQNIPKASNFYNSYILVQAVSGVGAMFLNIAGLAIFIILKNLLMKTPRKRYNQYISISGLGWGSTYPKVEIYTLIAMVYAIISPLILGFAAIGFLILYVAYRYSLIYVIDTGNIGTQGANYPRALQHIMVGVYIAQACLVGMLIIETANQPPAAGPLVIVILLLVSTIFAHLMISTALKPLVGNLPRDLLHSTSASVGESSQMESGAIDTDKSQGQISTSTDASKRSHPDTILAASQNQPGIKGRLLRILHPSWLPPLADHLSQPLPEYSSDVRREAYLDPAVTSPTPLIWLVHDDMGISAREKELTSKIIGVTDHAASWDNNKGNLVTIWEDQPYEKQDSLVKEAPIYEERVKY